jgi:anti-sigma regulatory factor (Ser/Thr protein kinase)
MEAAAHVHLRGGPEAARAARASLRSQLEGRLDEGVLDDMQLLVSEVVTNGIRHGDGEIDVEVLVNDKTALVRCRDRGTGFEPSAAPKPHADGSGGYGLVLVDRLSERWGVVRDRGSCVWFELAT